MEPSADTSSPAAAQGPEVVAFPASFAQQRLWFLEQFEPGTPLYNIPSGLRLRGRLDLEALKGALERIVERHETLRTTFRVHGEQLLQIISPPHAVEVRVTDLSALPDEGREAEALRLAYEEGVRPFDLARGPLLRAFLLRLGAEDHVLVLTMHHIVSDGWSMSIFFRELSLLYGELAYGEEAALEEMPIQYADYAEWQRERMAGEEMERVLGYWRERLRDGELPGWEMPGGRRSGGAVSNAGGAEALELGVELRRRLGEVSRREGVTLFMLLLAAWQVLLYRYSGGKDATVAVGTPIAGRTQAEVEGLIGFFINTLVVVSEVDAGATFRELLQQVREVTLEAYAHQELPFEKLVEALQPERDINHTPLFQVMFMLQNAPQPVMNFPGLTSEVIRLDNGMAKFPLSLGLIERDGGLTAKLDYKADLYEADSIRRMLGHYRVLLEAVAADPEQRVGDLPLMSEEERRQVLYAWNDTRRDYPRGELAHRPVERQAALTPDAVALSFGPRKLTYAQLERRANQLAHHLRDAGVRPESRVGVMLERSVEMMEAVIAVHKAGGAYVPLDPEHPAQRLALIIEDAGIEVVLTQRRLAASLPQTRARLIHLDEERAAVGARPATPVECAATAENLAYVIYTSGSTGTPKGVMVPHRAICNRLFYTPDVMPLTPDERLLQKTPFSFDASVTELFLPLWAGACLVMAPPGAQRDPARLVHIISDEQITYLQVVPTLLQALLEEPRLRQCKSLRRVFCGGEALTKELAERFFEQSDAELHNLYGPTEAAVDATHLRLRRIGDDESVSIGRPIANMRAYVLDRRMQPVPVGVAGELYLGGEGVARGYLGRPDMTAERFLPDPFGDEPGARLYRTGDSARLLSDGELEFLGRLDHQVKVRGFRIELGEVEASLASHPGVRECAVVARGGAGAGGQHLVAYYVAAGEAARPAELREHLRERLPDYMVPSVFAPLAEMPLTPSGKVDRRALPEVEGSDTLSAGYVEPEGEVEEAVASIWCGVLGVERVGAEDNFFELGGHSLLATRVVSRVRQALGVEVALRSLFEEPTVRGLARAVQTARTQAGAAGSGGTIGRRSRAGRSLPLPAADEL